MATVAVILGLLVAGLGALAAGDVDADGDADLVYAFGPKVAVFRNDGAGGFDEREDFGFGHDDVVDVAIEGGALLLAVLREFDAAVLDYPDEIYTSARGIAAIAARSSEIAVHHTSAIGLVGGEVVELPEVPDFIGLELGISVASAVIRGEPTGAPQRFIADVVSVAKKDLKPGDVLDGEGGYTVFGRLARSDESIKNSYLPIGLTANARIIRPVKKDTNLTHCDVEVDKNLLSYKLRKSMEDGFDSG